MNESHDATLALTRLAGVIGALPDPSRVVVFTHPGAPVSKERVRWSEKNHRFYTPGTTSNAESALAWEFKSALGRRPPMLDTIALVVVFHVPNRRRKDIDNMLKLVMDAGTKSGVWKDDSQVIVQAAYVVLEPDAPRTVVALAPCVGTLTVAPLLTATGAI